MAIDPAIFRGAGDFEADVATFLGALRATTPVDPARPVMVAGDPQWKLAANDQGSVPSRAWRPKVGATWMPDADVQAMPMRPALAAISV